MFSGFSVVIPTFERAESLQRCLDALAVQAYPYTRFEVIVVNDGGGKQSLPESPLPRIGNGTQLLNQSNQGPGAARNLGASHARFSHLAFTDDDCEPEEDWLLWLEQTCQLHPQSMVGGVTINRLRNDLYADTSQSVVSAAYRWHNREKKEARFLASNNMVCPRSEFLALGGFDPFFRTSEDRDLCDRWLRAGWTIVLTEKARIQHSHKLSAVAFWNQHRSYGRGAFAYHQVKVVRGGEAYRPDLTFFCVLLSEPFRTRAFMPSIMMALLSVLSQVASLHGYIEAMVNHRRCRTTHRKQER